MEILAVNYGVKWLIAPSLYFSRAHEARIDVVAKFSDDDKVFNRSITLFGL